MIAPIRWLTSSYGKSSRIPSLSTPLLLSVTQIDRPAFHPCHRFILRDGPSSRLTEPPLSLFLSPSLRIYPSLHSRTYRCFIGIHYLSTAANKSFPGVEGYRCTQVSAPGTRKVEERERENGKESHKASQSRPPERREIERSDIPSKGRFRRLGFLQPLLVNFLLRLTIIPEERIFPPSSNIWKIGRSGCFSRNERERERWWKLRKVSTGTKGWTDATFASIKEKLPGIFHPTASRRGSFDSLHDATIFVRFLGEK